MRYATDQEIAQGLANDPCYMDGKGSFLKQGEPLVRLKFDIREPGDGAFQPVDMGCTTKEYREKQAGNPSHDER